jgi:type 1 glutamine amidotransferase
MKHLYVLLLCFALFTSCSIKSEKSESLKSPAVLVFYKTAGYYHTSIPAGLAAIQKLGRENGFMVDTTKNAAVFVSDSLKKYKAVVFLSTTQDVLDTPQQNAFEQFIKAGGGFVGVHAATDTEYNWPWYNKLVGAYFESHPQVQNATVQVLDKSHISTSFLPHRWERKDEWYNFKSINPNVKVLANLDESSYKGGKNGANHPIAWYHTFDGGKAFYTAGGHTDESFQEPLFLRHLLGGIQYVLQD